MYLRHFWHAGGLKQLEPTSGVVTDAPAGVSVSEWGFVWRQGHRWFAIRSDNDSLIFQHGSNTWRLRPENEFQTTSGLFRRFTIIRAGQIEFSVRYRFGGTLMAAIDPTYDAIDEESDDFFLYVVSIWRSWKNKPMSAFEARGHIA